jgi:hypothetical protein
MPGDIFRADASGNSTDTPISLFISFFHFEKSHPGLNRHGSSADC